MPGNLVKARSTILFIVALLSASALALWIERESDRLERIAISAKPRQAAHVIVANTHAVPTRNVVEAPTITFSADMPVLPPTQPLSKTEREWASIAWTYFVNNTNPKTGLVNSVNDYPAATLWDTASYLLALIAANRLQLVPEKEFDARLKKALESLARLPLYDDALPNKSYDTRTLAMVDYTGNATPDGIGWSAIDIGRLLVPLEIIVWEFPRHAKTAKKVFAQWDMRRITQNGMLYGSTVGQDGIAELTQEGRLGYEQYAAKTFALMGLDVSEALSYRPHLAYVDVYGIRVPHDRRDPSEFGARNFVVSEPYMLDGLEFGWGGVTQEFAWRVYRAQEERYRKTGILTAVSEDHIDRPPYFVYNTVFSDGKVWNTITEAGEDAMAHRTLSTKTAFAWHALYRSPYTASLIEAVSGLHDKDKGWYAGRYEADNTPNKAITANTNAVILESLAFMANGKLISHRVEHKPTKRLQAAK